MLVSVIQIGNSKGVRLPKAILEQLDISEKLDLEVDNHQIILKPVNTEPRLGWNEAFKKMAELHDDALIHVTEESEEGFEWVW